SGQFALAVSVLSMAHRAVIAIELLGFREAFRRGFHRILLRYVIRGNGWWGRFGCLRGVFLLRESDAQAKKQSSTEQNRISPHIDPLIGRKRRGSKFGTVWGDSTTAPRTKKGPRRNVTATPLRIGRQFVRTVLPGSGLRFCKRANGNG